MHAPVLVTPPAVLPVTLAEAKLHLRIEPSVTVEDTLVTALIGAATSHLDGWSGVLGRALVNQTWRQDFDGFARCLRLPLSPVSSIASVDWRDTAGASSTVDGSDYQLLRDGLGPHVRFRDGFSFPSDLAEAAGVSVTFVAGHGAAGADVPAAIRAAMMLMIGAWYENREETIIAGNIANSMPASVSVNALLAPFRRIGV